MDRYHKRREIINFHENVKPRVYLVVDNTIDNPRQKKLCKQALDKALAVASEHLDTIYDNGFKDGIAKGKAEENNDTAYNDVHGLVRDIERMLEERDSIIARYRELYGELDDVGETNDSTKE